MAYLSIDLIVLLPAILIGLITFRKKHTLYLKIFPFFLLLILLVELGGQLLQEKGLNNTLLFNLFSVIEFFFFTYFFREVIPNPRIKKIITTISYLLPLLCLADIFLIQGPHIFHTYTYIIGCLVMVGLGITYFYHLFNSTERVDLLHEPAFWISIGIIFFFICSVSVVGSFNYISILPKLIRVNLQKILLLVNTFFYLIFIIAFLCQINILKSSSNS